EIKQWTQDLTHVDRLDVTLIFGREDGKKVITSFAVSYSTKIEEEWHEVIRYDTAHGFLHVQRFWRSPEPVPLPEFERIPYGKLVNQFVDEITDNMTRYRSYIEVKSREKGGRI
ncbi:MAG: hypothetical protein ACE5JP_16790, partial [Candidatus Bipolaricaulia bacterium]